MNDESGDESVEQSFHAVSKRVIGKTRNKSRSSKVATKEESSSPTSSSSESSSSSEREAVDDAQTPEPPLKTRKGGRKGKGKGKSSRQKPLKRPSAKRPAARAERKPAKKIRSKTALAKQEAHDRLDGFKLSSLEPLKWAEKLCLFAASHGGVCPYDSVDVFTEFSGTTCAESAVESVISHTGEKKPTLNFCYAADVKTACRQVAMSTRHALNECSLQYERKEFGIRCDLVEIMILSCPFHLRSNCVLLRRYP